MTIAPTIQEHLSSHDADYNVLEHPQTFCASQTAQKSHISGSLIAKGVVVKDNQGYLMAVLPAVNHIWFEELNALTERNLTIAEEEEASQLFFDCELGAFPALGAAYGLEVVLDDSLVEQPDIFIEGGDHASLLHMSGRQFERLMGNALHGHFSHHD